MKATITVEGSPDELAHVIRQLSELADVQLAFGPHLPEPPIDWDGHPALARLTPVEREIVRLDLACEPRRRIARQLDLTVGTVTVYRRSIRSKLRSAPPAEYPAPVREWLRRFPGQAI